MLELAGVKAPDEVQGTSVLPILKGTAKNWRTSFLSEYFMEKNTPRVPNWQAVRDAEWKYIHYTDLEGMDELYNVKTDPGEMKNLIHDAPKIAPAMKKELERYNQIIR